jgi:predicted transcriptional regulator
MTITTTMRLPDDLSEDALIVARADDITMSELVRLALTDYIARRRAQPDFQANLRARIEADRKLLDGRS